MQDEDLSPHEKAAQTEQRDEHGHFMHIDPLSPPPAQSQTKPNPLSQFLHDETAIKKTNGDELIDIHIGNPLRKIATLLEDIKKQKAFSFDIKGSLGVAGIILVLGTFGIFGGTRALCDKGIQTKSGLLTSLLYKEAAQETFIDKIPYLNNFVIKPMSNRIILKESNGNILHVTGKDGVNITAYNGTDIIATGSYDSCNNSLKLDSQTSIQPTQ